MKEVFITINAKIPDSEYTNESTEIFIKATIALFKGMFPKAEDWSHTEPPITISIDEEIEDFEK